MKVIFLIVLNYDYKLIQLIKNVIVLLLSDGEAFDQGAFDLGGFWHTYSISAGGVWPGWQKTGHLTGGGAFDLDPYWK